MRSIEIKRCESKLNNLNKLIKLKESEKSAKKEQLNDKKVTLRDLKSTIETSIKDRDRIGLEIKDLRQNSEKYLAEVNQIKVGLLYKTTHEYDEMIRRFENELQSNCRRFSVHEETRLLNDIKTHKQGKQQLEIYKEKNQAYMNLKELFAVKKRELDDSWKSYKDHKQRLAIESEAFKSFKLELEEIDKELDLMTKERLNLKKELEDLNRDNVMKQQLARKQSSEKSKAALIRNKEDEKKLEMESTLRDYSKLISYFKKLKNNEDIESGNSMSLSCSNVTTPTTSVSFHNFSLDESTDNFEDNTLLNFDKKHKPQLSFSMSAHTLTNKLEHPKTLLLLSSTKSQDYEDTQTPITLTQTPTYPLLPIMSPTVEETNSVQSNALFLLKKKNDDDLQLSMNRRRSNKKLKNKSVKVSHSVEIINLLTKLNIPIKYSSQIDECLNILRQRYDQLAYDLDIYKATQESLKLTTQNCANTISSGSSDAAKSDVNEDISSNDHELTDSVKNLIIQNDAKSEISSCLDSNYESDSNSLSQGASSKLDIAASFSIGNELEEKEEEECINNLTITSSTNQTITKNNLVNNSDDSDATVQDNHLFNKRKNSKSSSQRSTSSNNSNSNSDNTVTPGSPKTPTILNSIFSSTSSKEPNAMNRVETDQINKTQTFTRQLSDGYSSSCTPLSANSLNSEQAGLNPFFKSN